MKHVATRTIASVEENDSKFETTFSMVSCLSSNIVSKSVGWYVDNEES